MVGWGGGRPLRERAGVPLGRVLAAGAGGRRAGGGRARERFMCALLWCSKQDRRYWCRGARKSETLKELWPVRA